MATVNGNIFFVGLMGAGKTTIGKLLAKKLKKTFYDTDHEIEKKLGVKVSVIFELEGEEGFRKRETQMIDELSQKKDIILATGGGAVLSEENRRLLKERGRVIYLNAKPESLAKRMAYDKDRPLLQQADMLDTLSRLYKERHSLYLGVSSFVVDSGQQKIQTIINKIEALLKEKNMQTLHIQLEDRSYPIYIGEGLLSQIKLIENHLKQKQVAIVTNTTVAPLYLDSLLTLFKQNDIKAFPIILPDGEAYKNQETLNLIYDALLREKCERNVTLIALGGGVIGDMTGYAAATYLRGVPFIQIPTTLLAQVDSSVGGKTGINHPLGKNMIGAFYQPQCVIADIETLKTLPPREFSAGMAEVIKYGLIRDAAFFDWLEKNIEGLMKLNPSLLIEAILRSCQNKADVVEMDEHESGVRATLNLGHTFGHAIENAMGYGAWLHGEAVATGIVMAAHLSKLMGWLKDLEFNRIVKLLKEAKLPINPPKISEDQYMSLMSMDKKVVNGKIRLVLQKGIGDSLITSDYDSKHLKNTLQTLHFS